MIIGLLAYAALALAGLWLAWFWFHTWALHAWEKRPGRAYWRLVVRKLTGRPLP